MSLLLDTHVVLWWLTDDPALPNDVKTRLDQQPDVYLSSATVWEIAVKQSIGKIIEPAHLPEIIKDAGSGICPSPPPTPSSPVDYLSSTAIRSIAC